MGEGCFYENGKENGVDYVAANGNPGSPVARAQSLEDIESISVDKSLPSTLLPSTKSRKLSFERSDSKRYNCWVYDSKLTLPISSLNHGKKLLSCEMMNLVA